MIPIKKNNVKIVIVVFILFSIFIYVFQLVSNLTKDKNLYNNIENKNQKRLFKNVLGFYPASNEDIKKIHFNLLSTISFVEIIPKKDGDLITKPGWPPTELINISHANNVKVVVMIGSNDDNVIDSILESYDKQLNLTQNLIDLVRSNNLDGIDLDFEGINEINSVSGEFNSPLINNFAKTVSDKFWEINSSYQIIIDIPDNGCDTIWNISELQKYSTAIMIMAYDIHDENSSVAIPTAPIDDDNPEDPTVKNSIDTCISKGGNNQKLLLGVPFYGYIWPTNNNSRKSMTMGPGEYVSIDKMINLSEKYGRKWDETWKTPWFAYKEDDQWFQGHYDDNVSLGVKYDLVVNENLAGIGIWHLGYTNRDDVWKEIEDKFVH